MRLVRIVMMMVVVPVLAWTPSAMAQQAPKLPAEKEQNAVMAQKARAAALDLKIKALKAEIEALPKGHREEMAALLRESDQVPKDRAALRQQMSANAAALKRLSADRLDQEKAYHAARAELRGRRDAAEKQHRAVRRELAEKDARVYVTEHPGTHRTFPVTENNVSTSKQATAVSAQELPALKRDVDRLRAEEERLKAEGRRLTAAIEERDRAQAQRPTKSSQEQALRAEGNRLIAESAKLSQRETDVKAKIKALIDGDRQRTETRKAKMEELRRLQEERVALGR